MTTRSHARLILSPQASEAVWTRPIATGQFDDSFLPNGLSFLDWDTLRPFFKKLQDREVHTRQDFESWMRDLGALENLITEAFQHRHALEGLAPELSVTDTFARNVEHHEILWDTAFQGLYERLCEMPWLSQSDSIDRRRLYAVMHSRAQSYSWEAYSLYNQEERLVTQLEDSLGAIDTEITERIKDDWPDSKAWKYRMQRLSLAKPKLEELFTEILLTRSNIAKVRSHDNYITTSLITDDCLDYSARDVMRISSAVIDYFGPLADACRKAHAKNVGIKTIRPWDDISSDDLSYNEHFANEQILEHALLGFLRKFHPEAERLFAQYRDRFTFDLYESAEKQDGSFFSFYPRLQKGIVSTNLDGSAASLSELVHEVTHMIERVAASEKNPYFYYQLVPAELSERLALGMELIATSEYARFFSQRAAPTARRHLIHEGVIELVESARDTLFECSLYTDGAAGCGKRWRELHQRAFPSVDWRGLEEFRDVAYLDLFDDFASPLDSMVNLFGKLAAFQFYLNYQAAPSTTAEQMLAAMCAGDSLPLPELYATAGIEFPAEGGAIESLAARVKRMLNLK